MLGRALIEEALFNTGRPALIVPQSASAFSAEKVMIAWDHSSRAVRSVFDAMPILKAAENVEIVSVVNEKELAKEARDRTSPCFCIVMASRRRMSPLRRRIGMPRPRCAITLLRAVRA